MRYKLNIFFIAFIFSLSLTVIAIEPVVRAQSARPIIFPVIGPASFSNDFYALRDGGTRVHQAIDIIASKGQPLVAATHGTINYVVSPEASWGYSIGITDSQGYKYNYIHINNDTPGTNDNSGTEMNAYAPDMKSGNHVEAGQLIGWVGDSGRANGISHLHFEIEAPDGGRINPYDSLVQAPRTPTPSLYPPLSGETLPYWVEFKGGLNLAMGDLNGDNQSETVTAAGYGGGPHIKTYSSSNTFLGEFFAYDPNFRGGVDVAVGDVTGDGVDEIITGPGPGGGPWVRVFRANSQLLSQFAAYDPGFIGGIDVAAGDTAGNNIDEIITGPGPGGGPWVRVFNGAAQSLVDIQVYDLAFKGGVRVSSGNVRTSSSKEEIMTIPADYGESRVRLLSNSGANITDYAYLETWWKGYYDVAAGNNSSKLGTGINRRASMRNGPN